MGCSGCNRKQQIIKKTTSIVEGWTNLITKRYKNTPFVKHRAQICYKCKNLNNKTKFCKLCGCYIPAKITVKKEFCILLLWQKEA